MLLGNHSFRGKAISITHSECTFVALVIQHAMSMCHIIIRGLPSCTVFSHISYTARVWKKKVIKHKMRVLIFSTLSSETFLILKRIERDIIKDCIGLRVKNPLFLSGFNETWNFLGRFSKKYPNIKLYENSFSGNEVVPCGRTYKQTDRYYESICRCSQRFERV
jgi:hypothetical protein